MIGRKLLREIAGIFGAAKNYLDGDFAYQNYLAHQKKNHSQQKVMDKKTFLKNYEEKKWSKVNRCC